jgi:hypothetical protein
MVLTQMLNVYANGFKDDESTLPCSTSIYQYEDHRRHLAAGERAGMDRSATVDNKYYEAALPGSLAERVSILARNRIYNDFLRLCRPMPKETILDLGVSDVTGDAANLLERRYPFPDRITAAGIGAGEAFRTAFPRVSYLQIAANQPLPFANRSFDIATSNAVLEHVGKRTSGDLSLN